MSAISVPALKKWLVVQAFVWLPLLLALAWGVLSGRFESSWIFAGLFVLPISFVGLWLALHPAGNRADLATVARFALLLVAVAWTALAQTVTWPLWCLWFVVVVSDLLDGWLARRYGGSDAGEILDMETDQLTTLSLSAVAAAVCTAGVWTLILPGLKYVFALAMIARGTEAHQAKPVQGENLRGKRICAAVMSLLLLCVLPAAAPAVRMTASLVAVLLLGYSFSSDALFLLRSARRPSTLG